MFLISKFAITLVTRNVLYKFSFVWTFSTWTFRFAFGWGFATIWTGFFTIFFFAKLFSFLSGLSRISEVYWANQGACCWMNLVEENVWKTQMQYLATGLHPIKMWRSMLRMLIQRKFFKTHLFLTFNLCNFLMIAVWLWSCVNISIP